MDVKEINKLHKELCKKHSFLGFECGEGGGNGLSAVLLEAIHKSYTLAEEVIKGEDNE